MEKLTGGVSLEEYCKTLKIIMDNNPNTETMEFFYSGFGCKYFE